jgi:hypothetical protein
VDVSALPIDFGHTGDGEYPYRAETVLGVVVIRVNDFPAEPLYSIFIDDVFVTDLEDWPEGWVRPPLPQHLRDLITGS